MATKPSKLTVLSVLKAGQWFQGLATELLDELAQLSVIQNYSPGEHVFVRDEPGRHLYGIISGKVRVTTQSRDGRELALNTMRSGDVGGEVAALDGGLRTASWTAVEPTTVFKISRTHLQQLMLRQPGLALHMINVLCRRVRDTSQQVEDAAFLTVPQRLAGQLYTMWESLEPAERDNGKIRISQRELASFLSSSRQVVNGYLQEWQRLGLISVGRGYVAVTDVEGMLAAAQEH